MPIIMQTKCDPDQKVFAVRLKGKKAQITGPHVIVDFICSAIMQQDESIKYSQEYILDNGEHVKWATHEKVTEMLEPEVEAATKFKDWDKEARAAAEAMAVELLTAAVAGE